jgi:hypothetical protein
MSENWIPKETTTKYLIEGDDAQFRVQAEKALKIAKDLEAKKETIPVWYNERTTKFVSLEKIKRKKLEIIKVKIGKGELVFMEKNVAIKNRFINE